MIPMTLILISTSYIIVLIITLFGILNFLLLFKFNIYKKLNSTNIKLDSTNITYDGTYITFNGTN